MDWQTILSLSIVAITAVLLVRRQMKERKKAGCSNCALVEMKNNVQYVPKKFTR